MVADALIYHPTVTHYLKFVAVTGTSLSYSPLDVESRTSLHKMAQVALWEP